MTIGVPQDCRDDLYNIPYFDKEDVITGFSTKFWGLQINNRIWNGNNKIRAVFTDSELVVMGDEDDYIYIPYSRVRGPRYKSNALRTDQIKFEDSDGNTYKIAVKRSIDGKYPRKAVDLLKTNTDNSAEITEGRTSDLSAAFSQGEYRGPHEESGAPGLHRAKYRILTFGGKSNDLFPDSWRTQSYKSVLFTDTEIKIPEVEITIPYSDIYDYEPIAESTHNRSKKKGFGRTEHTFIFEQRWRFILTDGSYFALSQKEKETVTGAGAPEISHPSLPEKISDLIKENVQEEGEDIPEYILVEPAGEDGELRIEGWTDGDAEVQAGISANSESKGKSKGVEVGPFSRSKTTSESTIEGELEGAISDNTYSTSISSFFVFDDHLEIDSELNLELYFDEIGKVTKSSKGLIIEAANTTYRTKIRKNHNHLSNIVEFVKGQMGDGEDGTGEPRSSGEESMAKIRQMKELHEDGILSDEEFESKKQELLDEF